MPTLALRRPNFPCKWAIFGFVIAAFSLAASDASAQSGGGLRGHFQRFYGQDFYDGQHGTRLFHRDLSRVYHDGHYGPSMMYGRQYVDEVGYRTDPPFWFPRPSTPNPYHAGYSSDR